MGNSKSAIVSRVAHWTFLCLLLISGVLAYQLRGDFRIDTNLADISPQGEATTETKNAIKQLSANIEQRVLLLITSADEDAALDAQAKLIDRLQSIELIDLSPTPEELVETLIASIKQYRFALLTDKQRQSLLDDSVEKIAERAKAALYDPARMASVYRFEDDPLGWHGATAMALFKQPSSTENAQITALPISLSINRGALNMQVQQQLTLSLEEIITDLRSNYAVTVDRSGVFFFAAEAAKNSRSDITLISAGSSIGVVLLLLFAFRSITVLLLPVISILLGVSFAFIVTHTLYGQVHVLTIVFGASLIGIVIDYSLHYFYHSAQQASKTGDEKSALHRALGLSLVTSLIGYSALGFSDIQALQKVAVFSCCGLLMAWLSVISLGALGLTKSVRLNQSLIPRLVSQLSRLTYRLSSRLWSGLAASIIIAATSILLFGSPFNDDPRLFFNAPQALLESERRVAAVANDYEPGRYIIIKGQSQSEVYNQHALLFELIEANPTVTAEDFTSLLRWVPSIEEQASNYQAQAKLYSDRGAASLLLSELNSEQTFASLAKEYQQAANLSLQPALVASVLSKALPPFWVENEQNIVNFVLIRKGVNIDALESLISDLPGVEYVNTLQRTESALKSQRQSALLLLLVAYLLIAVLVSIRFSSIRATALLIAPACASCMLVVLGFVAGFELNLFHVMALFLVLGFGMDYTIFAREMHTYQDTTLQAIFLSALTSLLSFGLLGLSAIPVVAAFGTTLLIGNSFNLLGAIIYSRSLTKSPTQS